MITCPKCGAENKSDATSCRMCATSLASANALPPTAIFENKQGANSPNPGEAACPTCGTMNEADWAFCQQCGTKLRQAARPPAQPSTPSGMETVVAEPPSKPAPGPDEFKTVVAQPPVIDPQFKQGLKTVSSEPVTAEPQAPQSQRTVPERPPASEPQAAPAQPAQAAQPPAQQPHASAPSYNAPAGKGQISNATEQVQSLHSAKVETVACPQCSHPNNTGGLFCAKCGASLTVAKTVVMSSYSAPPKGKLQLVMEGGQAGDAWEIDDETVIGRTAGEITFPHDSYMSGRHASIVRRGNSFILVDEGSRNGTFIKIKNEVELKPGDMILVGKQLFRFEV